VVPEGDDEMNRIRKILSLKFWLPVLCVSVILIMQPPWTKVDMVERIERDKKILKLGPHVEAIKPIDWGKVIGEGVGAVGSAAVTARALIELIVLFKKRKSVSVVETIERR